MANDRLGRFRGDLKVLSVDKNGGKAFRVVDPVSNVAHELWELEHVVATMMDGKRSADDIVRECAVRGLLVSSDHVRKFHLELEGMGFVVADQQEPAPDPDSTSHRSDAATFIAEARALMASGRFDLAKGLLEAALQIDDSDPDAYIGLARCTKMLSQGAPAEAIALPGRPPPAAFPGAPEAIALPGRPPPAAIPLPGRTDESKTGAWPVEQPKPTPAAVDDDLPIPIEMSKPPEPVAPIPPAVPVELTAMPVVPVLEKRGSPLRAAVLLPLLAIVVGLALVKLGIVRIPGLEIPNVSPSISADAGLAVVPVADAGAVVVASTDAGAAVVLASADAGAVVASVDAGAVVASVDAGAVVASVDAGAAVVDAGVVAAVVASGPIEGEVVDVVHPPVADVVATIDGKFIKAFVNPGTTVKKGRKLLIIENRTTPESFVISPADGAFFASAQLGARVKKADVIGAIVDPRVWHVSATMTDASARTKCALKSGKKEAPCTVVSSTPTEGGVVSVKVVASVTRADAAWLTAETKGATLVLSP